MKYINTDVLLHFSYYSLNLFGLTGEFSSEILMLLSPDYYMFESLTCIFILF